MILVSRAEWGARPPSAAPATIAPTGWAIHWEGPGMGAFEHPQCAGKVSAIQNFHMGTRRWSDIAYNFLVCPHGHVFEGRGYNVRSAANGTNAANGAYMAVCFLGGEGDPFTPEAQAAMAELTGDLGNQRPHSDFFNTSCPGDEIRAWVEAGCPTNGNVPLPPEQPPPPVPEPVPAPPVSQGTDVHTPYLSQGSTGPQVVAMQAMLNFKEGDRASLAVDGDFGPVTDAKVRSFQSYYQLGADGIVGPITWQALVDT